MATSAAAEPETRPRVLIVEDRPWDAELMIHELRRSGVDCISERVETEPEFVRALEELDPDVVLADYALPRFSGLRALHILKERHCDTPLILVSGAVTEEKALECLRQGAVDYVLKQSLLRLGPAVGSALEHARIRRAHEASRRRLAALSTIVQDSLNEIYVFSAESLRFLDANGAASRNTGYSLDELARLSVLELKPEFDRDRFDSILVPLRRGEREVAVFQTVHRRKDQSEYPVEVHLQCMEYIGEPAFVAIALDLGERRSLEQELARAQRMEAVGKLAAGIAHDFNNLLTVILGNAGVLGGRLGLETLEERALVREIERAADQGADLVRRLMTLSREEPLQLERVELSSLVEDAARFIRSMLPADIDLVREENHDGVFVRVDRAAIGDVLLNLAANARDAMPSGGTLFISTSITGRESSGADAPHQAEIVVRDTGVGMDAEKLRRAFEPFFSTKGEGRGTGLGLARARTVILRHDGTIGISSKPSAGTAVAIRLPLSA